MFCIVKIIFYNFDVASTLGSETQEQITENFTFLSLESRVLIETQKIRKLKYI